MSVNLLDMAHGLIGGPIMDQLGGVLGEDRNKTEAAARGSLPAILGGLMQAANSPGGMANINRAADEADGGLLDNLGDMLSNNSGMLMTLGAPILGMLFGGKQDGLIGAIAKMAGIGNGSAGSLLKVLAPIVIGMLGRQKKQNNLDEGGMFNLLMDQREHVAAAMPAEVSSTLNFGDFLDQETRSAERVEPVAPAADRAVDTTYSTPDAPSGGGMMRWLLPLAVIAGLAYLAFNFLGGDKGSIEEAAKEAGASVTAELPDVAGMKDKLTESLGGLATSLEGITDEESAQAVVEKIGSAQETVEGLGLDKLPEAAGFLGPLVEKIEGALEAAYKIPGVEGIIKPAIEPLLEKLKGI